MKPGSLLVSKALRSEKVRFGLVGVVNTSVDFILLFVLARVIGLPVIPANMVSTLMAVGVSYLLNKKAVFRNAESQGIATIVAYVVVTLLGLWGLQTVVILIVTPLLDDMVATELSLFIAKVLATLASLIWNYLWYSRVIFRKKHDN